MVENETLKRGVRAHSCLRQCLWWRCPLTKVLR
jgi:hypothetical protein